MKFGLGLPTCHEGLINPAPFFEPSEFVRVAQLAEQLGYDSVWGTDHYSNQEYVRNLDASPPNFYEPLIVLSAIATATQHVELATAVLVPTMRDIVTLTKQVMTLDQLSKGRVVLGVGVGAYRQEYVAARPDLVGKDRGDMLEEALELFGRLATERIVTFEGRYYRTNEIEMYPKPYRDTLPILIAGSPERAIDRVVRLGQGWIPGWMPFDQLAEWVRIFRERAAQAGRDPTSMIVAPQHACLLDETQEAAETRFMASRMAVHRKSLAATGRKLMDALDNMLVGTPVNVLEKIERLREAGVDQVASITFTVNSVAEYLEQLHLFAEEVMVPYRRNKGVRSDVPPQIESGQRRSG